MGKIKTDGSIASLTTAIIKIYNQNIEIDIRKGQNLIQNVQIQNIQQYGSPLVKFLLRTQDIPIQGQSPFSIDWKEHSFIKSHSFDAPQLVYYIYSYIRPK